MVEIKPILGTVVGLQSLALVGSSYNMIPKDMYSVPRYRVSRSSVGMYKGNYGQIRFIRPVRIRNTSKTFVKGSVGLMVGIPLISGTAGMINNIN